MPLRIVAIQAKYVTIGKGTFLQNGQLSPTEFLAAEGSPAGSPRFVWEQPDLIQEISSFKDEDGKVIQRTGWKLRKTNPMR